MQKSRKEDLSNEDNLIHKINRFTPYLVMYAMKLGLNKEDAEDMVQELWLKIHIKKLFADKKKLHTKYLKKMLKNSIFDEYRKQKKYLKIEYKEKLTVGKENPMTTNDIFGEALNNDGEMLDFTKRFLNSLDKKYRNLFERSSGKKINFRYLSMVLNRKKTTIKKQYYMILKRFKKAINEFQKQKQKTGGGKPKKPVL